MFEGNLTLSFVDVQNLSRPCVYIFWLDTLCQYVGKSEHGIIRPFSPHHHKVSLPDFRYDRLEVLWQIDYETAGELEKDLIWEYSPQYNEQCVSYLPRRSSGIPMPSKGYDMKTAEFLVISETGEVVFRSKDRGIRGDALRNEMTRFRKAQATEFKRQAKQNTVKSS